MILDADVREAFTRAYAKHQANPHRVCPEDAESPVDLVYRCPETLALQQRDRHLQYRADKGLDREKPKREPEEFREPPLNAVDLARVLKHYNHALGETKYFDLHKMAAMRLPMVVWQRIFSAARKREEQGHEIKDAPAYILRAAKKESFYVKLVSP